MRSDIYQQLADYRGILAWNALTDAYTGTSYGAVTVELYFKDFPIPIRKQKATEVMTVPTVDPSSQLALTTNLIFFGAPDILQVSASGFILTPTSNKQFAPLTDAAAAFPVTNLNWGEIVSGYLQGDFSKTVAGAPIQTQPAYFISPYGQKYLNPTIFTWEALSTPNQRRQQFTIGMYLEK